MRNLLLCLAAVLFIVVEVFAPAQARYEAWATMPYNWVSHHPESVFCLFVIIAASLGAVVGLARLIKPNANKALDVLSSLFLAAVFVLTVKIVASAWFILLLACDHGAKLLTNFVEWHTVAGLAMLALLAAIISCYKLTPAHRTGLIAAVLLMSLAYAIPGYYKASGDIKEQQAVGQVG